MWELDCEEGWAPKNWCFWTVVLEKTLESPLDCKEIHQSILKEISPGCSLEGLMLKLKLQYFGHLMRRVDWLEKTLMLGGIGGRGEGDDRGWDGWMASLTRWHESVWTLGVGDGQGGLACCDSWGCKESDTREWLNWTELNNNPKLWGVNCGLGPKLWALTLFVYLQHELGSSQPQEFSDFLYFLPSGRSKI